MGRKTVIGKTDLVSWCIQHGKSNLLDEWDNENNSCNPETKSFGSHYKAAWKCSECNHRWKTEIKCRTLSNAGCPQCGIAKVRTARSKPKSRCDFESFCNENRLEWLLNEWDYYENDLLPQEVSRSSSKYKAAWKCAKCGYQWKLTPNNRVKVLTDGKINVSQCPMCIKEKQTSFPEQAIFFYVSQCFPDAINGDYRAIGAELDIYIPSLQTAIEYDGYAWHQDVDRDIRKNLWCKEKKIKIFRIREEGCPSLCEGENCRILHIRPNSRESLTQVILDLHAELNVSVNVDLTRDEPLIMALYQRHKYENSIGYLYPELAEEFHTKKNGTLSVDDINKASARKVWWQCRKCNHEWLAAVSSRTSGHGCPACSGRVLVPGTNDFETWCNETGNTHILSEWDYGVNSYQPSEVTKKSPYVAAWKCGKCSTSYTAKVYNRANGCGCPVCAGKKVKSGINDFRTWCINNAKEILLEEWDEENTLHPSQVSHGSGKRFMWVCSVCNHRWPATLDNRKKGKGCPQCGNIKRAESNRKRHTHR